MVVPYQFWLCFEVVDAIDLLWNGGGLDHSMFCDDTATVAVRSSMPAPGLLAVGRRGIRQIFSSGNRHPLRTSAWDVVIFVFLLSYILTSS